VPHDRADGDACGSMLALATALEKAGKRVHKLLLGGLSSRYEAVFAGQGATVLGKDISLDQIPDVQTVVFIDTTSSAQITPIAPWLEKFCGTVVAIDHHPRGDLCCDAELVDETRAATGLLVGMLLEHLGWLDDPVIAGHLLIAIGTDTGWFRYSNVTAECFWWAAKLAELGAPVHGTYEKLFLSDPPERFELMVRALCSRELLAGGRIVAFTLNQRDFSETGASEAYTENIIDEAARLKTMEVAVLFVERSDGKIGISLRSRGQVDVSRFARRLGGGGHRRAAGIELSDPLDQVKSRILKQLTDTLEPTG